MAGSPRLQSRMYSTGPRHHTLTEECSETNWVEELALAHTIGFGRNQDFHTQALSTRFKALPVQPDSGKKLS